MTYIINPMWFYWLSVADKVDCKVLPIGGSTLEPTLDTPKKMNLCMHISPVPRAPKQETRVRFLRDF